MNRVQMMVVAVLATVMTVAGGVFLAAPAWAEDGTHHAEASIAFDGAGPNWWRRVETRAQVRWDTQGDGTGSVLEFLDVDTIDGCNHLPDNGNAYYNTDATFYTEADQTVYGDWSWGDEPCNWTKNHDSVRGSDAGAMIYYLRMCAEDDRLWWKWRLYSGGDSVLLEKGHEERPQICPR